jgi:hypothetical protein
MPYPLFLVTSNPSPVQLIWVDSRKLDEMLAKEYLVSTWVGGPRDAWFRPRGIELVFLLPEIYFRREDDVVDVMVPNGRHRIRWLITRGDCEIPVGLSAADVSLAHELGLALRRVEPTDVLP